MIIYMTDRREGREYSLRGSTTLVIYDYLEGWWLGWIELQVATKKLAAFLLPFFYDYLILHARYNG